ARAAVRRRRCLHQRSQHDTGEHPWRTVRALAMAWPTRSPLLPEIPTFAELGLPAVISSSWAGLAAPVNTPPNIVARLAEAMRETFASNESQAGLKKLGNEQFTLSPA